MFFVVRGPCRVYDKERYIAKAQGDDCDNIKVQNVLYIRLSDDRRVQYGQKIRVNSKNYPISALHYVKSLGLSVNLGQGTVNKEKISAKLYFRIIKALCDYRRDE